MRKFIFYVIALSLLSIPARAGDIEDIKGLWLTKKRDVAIAVSQCGDGNEICGYVAWLSPEAEVENPDLCGMRVLWGARKEKDDPLHYTGGTLYKADEGQYYGAALTLESADRLALRGYVGFPALGKTKILTRVGADYPNCQI